MNDTQKIKTAKLAAIGQHCGTPANWDANVYRRAYETASEMTRAAIQYDLDNFSTNWTAEQEQAYRDVVAALDLRTLGGR